MGWIIIRNWDKFQHYGSRQPPWIKLYVQLVHDDDFQALSPSDRSVLISLWMIYAMTRRRVRDNTAVISRSIGQRVTKKTLERLNHAGFIDVSASKPLAPELELEVEEKRLKRARAEPGKTPGLLPTSHAKAVEAMIRNGVIHDQIDLDAEVRGYRLDDDLAQQLSEELARKQRTMLNP